jgi:hypothetical protein
MRGTSTLASVLIVLTMVGCTAHQRADERYDACPNSGLYETLEGSWRVGYADYEDRKEPAGSETIGELQIASCRYRFIASEDPGVELELKEAREELPFVRIPSGTVKVLSERGIVQFRAGPRVGGVAIWEGELSRFGEYLYFDDLGRGSLSRGKRPPIPNQMPRSMDPETIVPRGTLERMQEQAEAEDP